VIDNPLQIFSPVVYQEKVYIPTGKKLFCLNLTNGNKIWEKEYPDIITSSPGFTENDILFTQGNHRLSVIKPANGIESFGLEFGEKSTPYFVTVRDLVYIAYNYTKNIGGKDIIFTMVRAYRFGDNEPIWEFQPPFPGGTSQLIASGGTLFVPAGNYLYAVGTYYERPVTFGNDGNTYTTGMTNSESISNDRLIGLTGDSNSIASNTLTENKPLPDTNKPVNLEETKKGENVVVPNIYFEFNQAYLLKQSIAVLDKITGQLKKNTAIRLEIQGYTDNIGGREYNQNLSERRADAVKDYLIKNGISPERLRSAGFGMDKPVADNSTAQGRSQNRRTEFLILNK
jgi:outer membrane protein OmpA-like peptidoglycan-associated protein